MARGGVHSRPSSEKYYLSTCQDDANNNINWIEVYKAVKRVGVRDIDIQKSQVLFAKMKTGNSIVIKIGNDNKLYHEYMIGRKLKSIKGFVKFICYFECDDNFYDYFTKESGYLCKGPGNSMKVILMPHFPLGSLAAYVWTNENCRVLKSCIKMACLTICDAYEKKGIVHGDFHGGNVMLKETRQREITYDNNISIPTYGYRTWIMDFENSQIVEGARGRADHFYDMKRFITVLPTFITGIDKGALGTIINFISSCEEGSGGLDKITFCKSIDLGLRFQTSPPLHSHGSSTNGL